MKLFRAVQALGALIFAATWAFKFSLSTADGSLAVLVAGGAFLAGTEVGAHVGRSLKAMT